MWVGHVSKRKKTGFHTEFLWGNLLKKRTFGKVRRRREDNIKMGIRKLYLEDGMWIELAQDHIQWLALISAVLISRVLQPLLVYLAHL
jgi:hypothetical protein